MIKSSIQLLFKTTTTTNSQSLSSSSTRIILRHYATATPIAAGDTKAKASHFMRLKGSCKSAGIVGLPNIGKSSLFNALTSSQSAAAANFPFCTIDPNIGLVMVPDERLNHISKLLNTKSKVETQLEFVDIAGLVKGASDGEGLGNKFLANIRQVSLIVHLVRCFEDGNITHVHDHIDPIKDIETIETELILADMQSLEKVLTEQKKRPTPEQLLRNQVAQRVIKSLEGGVLARDVEIEEKEWAAFQSLHLLTCKPILYTCNVGEADVATGNKYTEMVKEFSRKQGSQVDPVIVSAKIESEVANLESEEMKKEFLQLYGLTHNGLSKVINGARNLMGLQSYYTASERECRAWTIPVGTKARAAAGVIHSDFEKGFIKADTIAYQDFIDVNGDEKLAKEKGKQRQEGPNYLVQDGDVMFFKFNL
ncbi:GTP-binding protein [Cavenderia fasciculata]|uniref:Obg-like ATPase 1 n=1 Tax=Cavenderia fasciculata TaxID=261658 RepID=F4PR24_CACFS|nr:GTP-binding protein [Cavenderia fasciculata]EGG22081.1 GTP-binding protein [Cavenderia fasciculata]|eukprot:XP_004359932.1 GTP-binding protein [Cavenderia fasciculata]